MEFDIYFPHFEEILFGVLRPELPTNTEGHNYLARLQTQILSHVKQTGRYVMKYPEPFNSKTTWYYRLLTTETYLYCTDIVNELSEISDPRERSYLRDQLLDKHLTSCLQLVGEKIRKRGYGMESPEHPTVGISQDERSNSYIYHLLKVCLAKAFLEIQAQLADVVSWKQAEKQLYQGVVGEMPPVISCLTLKPATSQPTPTALSPKTEPHSSSTNSTADVDQEEFMTVAEIAQILRKDERTILRRINDGLIPARKEGRSYLISRKDFEAYKATL